MYCLQNHIPTGLLSINNTIRSYLDFIIRMLLCKPVWMWGASMGSNSAGISICIESITPSSNPSDDEDNDYLTGMDLLRLALMFGDSALDAVEIIDHYLSSYEQKGIQTWMNSGANIYYSTFLIAEYNEVWIVETVNQMLVAKKFHHGIHTISNQYALSAPFDMISNELRDYCDDQGINWKHDLDMNNQFTSWRQRLFDDSTTRTNYIHSTLGEIIIKRKLVMNDFCNILRSHQIRFPSDTDEINGIDQGIMGMNICAHAGYGPLRRLQSTNSMICVMRRDGKIINFVTGTSAPCISIFKPIYIGCTVPNKLGVGYRKFCNGNFIDLDKKNQKRLLQTYDTLLKRKNDIISTTNALVYNDANKNQLWWKHEVFHRKYIKYFIDDQGFNQFIKCKINLFEEGMYTKLIDEYVEYNSVHSEDEKLVAVQQEITDRYWLEANTLLDEFLCKTQIEIDVVNKMKKSEGIGKKIRWLLALILNGWVMITKYLHQRQWNHWNKMCRIHMNDHGVIGDKQKIGITGMLSLFFSGENSIYRWIKVTVLSAWSVLTLALVIKYFS